MGHEKLASAHVKRVIKNGHWSQRKIESFKNWSWAGHDQIGNKSHKTQDEFKDFQMETILNRL
jgi:hypothetical protein